MGELQKGLGLSVPGILFSFSERNVGKKRVQLNCISNFAIGMRWGFRRSRMLAKESFVFELSQ